MTDDRVDLRAAARAFLAERAHLAILPDALERIRAIARADSAVLAPAPEAALRRQSSSADVRGGVAVIPLQGIITPQGSWLERLFGAGGGGLQGFRATLDEALGSDDVSAIVLDVHSPGGLISLVPEVAAELRDARGQGKRIVAVANTMAGSAAYWLAAQADEVVVTPSGFAGSIGVYLVHVDWSGANAQEGIDPTYIAAGRFKTEGHADAPLDDTAKAALQAEVDDLYALFVDDVAAGRGTTAAAVRAGYGEGRVLPAQRALAADLVDRVATIDDVIRELAGSAGGRPRAGAIRRAQRETSSPVAVDPAVQARLDELQTLTPPVHL